MHACEHTVPRKRSLFLWHREAPWALGSCGSPHPPSCPAEPRGPADPSGSGLTDGPRQHERASLVLCWAAQERTREQLQFSLLKTQPHFYGRTKGNGTLGTQGLSSTQINATHPTPPRVSENYFWGDMARSPLPPANRGEESSPLTTVLRWPCKCHNRHPTQHHQQQGAPARRVH